MSRGSEFVKRGGSLLLAGVFLITAVGFTVVAIWQSRNDNNTQAEMETSLEQPTSSTEETTNTGGENMLQGTTLANFTPVTTPVTELQVIDISEGTGEVVPEGATITAHYTGAYAGSGTIFQSSKDFGEPIAFSLNGVIAGWTQGVPGMKVGGVRRLVIPGAMAYGEAPEGYTEGSTDRPMGPLVFDIELVKIGE